MVHEMSGYRSAKFGQAPFIPSQAHNVNKNGFVCQQERQGADRYGADSLVGSPEHSLQVRQMLVSLGRYKWVLAGIHTDDGLGFACPMKDANALSTVTTYTYTHTHTYTRTNTCTHTHTPKYTYFDS